ncbi:unnamed protein product [Owenia fusiformis]|uniref:pyridoxal 5'-phosphate synthase n=1 Tax=Owenia fusiformis TaxID=6347 RepID=A0A8J1XRS8_OWEFU|nr:unnamed protein product [Owenia fusiformis]
MLSLIRNTLIYTRLVNINLDTTLIRMTSSMSNGIDVAGMRKPYKGDQEAFEEDSLVAKEPIAQFKHWFEIACQTDGIREANAMSLATATKTGVPSLRIVLLKGYDDKGFRFYTNYESRKGKEIAENPRASLMFYWEPLMRSVRIEGIVEKLSEEESTTYFHSRPRSSQIGAIVSHQSTIITGRDVLRERNEKLTNEYADESKEIPKPDYWGGYVVKPHMVEFWQGQTNRVHDRIVFRKHQEGETFDETITHPGDAGWVYERLAP